MAGETRKPRLEGKVILVTGAGSRPGDGVGTGKAMSVLFAREGARGGVAWTSTRARSPRPCP